MEQQLPENMRVLRLFGAEPALLAPVFAQAQESKGVKIQSMVQGSEMLVLLEAVTQSGSATMAVLNGWQEQIETQSKGALYATGEATLPKATVDLLIQQEMLFSCVDAQTSALMETKLEQIPGLDAVYDFGAHSHAHPKLGRKIAMGSKFAAKYPAETAQQLAGKVKAGYQYSGANYVVAILPMQDDSSLVMVGEKAGYWLRRVPKHENVVLWAVDMLRRAAQQVPQAKGSIRLAYGAPMPAFAVAESIVDKGDDFIAPEQSQFDAPPAPKPAKKAGLHLGAAVLCVVLIAVAAIAVGLWYTGGDLASLWNDTGLNRFNVSSATLL